MGEIKPLGSERLNGDDKLKRILELTYFNNNNKSLSSSKPNLVKESKNGGVYGVVKEKDGYYVKRGLNESSLDYIGGMFMKNKNRFSSYAEAFKRLDLLVGQENIQEATKYVLKQNKPQQEAPMAAPSMDTPPPPAPDASGDSAPTPDMGGDSVPTDTPAPTDAPTDDGDQGGDEDAGKRSSYMAEAQKYAGKLGQELRDLHDKMESDDIKYILNMIISAVDLDKLSDEDIEEMAKKFDREDKEGSNDDQGGNDTGTEIPDENGNPEPAPTDVNEYDAMGALDEFVNTPMDTNEPSDVQDIDLSKYAIKEEGDKEHDDDTQELDLDEIKNDINNAIGTTLSKYFK
jgi:hypothetical protein